VVRVSNALFLLQALHFIRCRPASDRKKAARWIENARREVYIRKTLQKEVIPMESQATQFLDLYRAGVRTASEVMKASLESVERIQNQQLQVFRAAMEENVKLMDFYGGVWRNASTQVQGAMRNGVAAAAGTAANQEKRPEPQRKSA
jgi:hypothetical protein